MIASELERFGKIALITAIAVVASYLLTRHLGHIGRYLPLAVLFVCPAMHMVMHRRRRRRSVHHNH